MKRGDGYVRPFRDGLVLNFSRKISEHENQVNCLTDFHDHQVLNVTDVSPVIFLNS